MTIFGSIRSLVILIVLVYYFSLLYRLGVIKKKACITCKPLISLVAGRGFEPLTFGL
jgi:hypothetical protein